METTGLIERCSVLLPAIRERREEIERARRLPRDLVDRLSETGLFSLELPRVLGGQEGNFSEGLRAIETLATADGSTAWCAALALSVGGAVAFMSEAGGREVFADPKRPRPASSRRAEPPSASRGVSASAGAGSSPAASTTPSGSSWGAWSWWTGSPT